MKIEQYGFCPSDILDTISGTPARVTAVHRGFFQVACDFGIGLAKLKTGVYRPGGELIPTTGDFVLINWQAEGESLILKTLPRKSFFSRLDPSSSGYKEQAVAANFDYVFLLQSLNCDFNPRRLERYLTLAWQSGATPVVVLTKADRAENIADYVLAAEKIAVGADVIPLSAKDSFGMERLAPYLKPGKTIVLLGSSGVGKSTLVNALAGEAVMATERIREKDGRGRHTTSVRQLIMLKSGVMVIDTPGMRELGLWDVSEGLEQGFSDVEAYLGQCKFSDCRHQGEPGCAVAAAIRRGELQPERWESYQKLYMEAQYAEDKAGYLRKKRQRHKEISKRIKAMHAVDFRSAPCTDSFHCKVCGSLVTPQGAGSQHRNHCPKCLSSVHMDNRPGDRASLCKGVMEPVAVWVRNNGEWALIHRCTSCGVLSSNRIGADDDSTMLLSLAMEPLRRLKAGGIKTGHKAPGDGARQNFSCGFCGTTTFSKEGNHCPNCLRGVHMGGSVPCKGVMEPIAVRIDENGGWRMVSRCRSCGALEEAPVTARDNTLLLVSTASKPLSAPPFPLWRMEQYQLDQIEFT